MFILLFRVIFYSIYGFYCKNYFHFSILLESRFGNFQGDYINILQFGVGVGVSLNKPVILINPRFAVISSQYVAFSSKR